MIKLVHKEGNIKLTAPTGLKQSEVNEMLAAQEERLEAEHTAEITELNETHAAEIEDINEAHADAVNELNTAHTNEINGLNAEITELEEEIEYLKENGGTPLPVSEEGEF